MAYAGGGGGQVLSPPAAARVHCSICGKLLPKLDGSKVYRCGDCNAAAIQGTSNLCVFLLILCMCEKETILGVCCLSQQKERRHRRFL